MSSTLYQVETGCLTFFGFTLEAVRSAVEHLELLGAVERKEGQVLLTALGKKMASFPLEPRYAKVKHVWTFIVK